MLILNTDCVLRNREKNSYLQTRNKQTTFHLIIYLLLPGMGRSWLQYRQKTCERR